MTQQSEHQEISARMTDMERKIDALILSIEAIKGDVSETKEIVAAWKSVKLWAAFLKWAAGVVASIGVMYAAWKGFHR